MFTDMLPDMQAVMLICLLYSPTINNARFEVFVEVYIQVTFRIVTPHSVTVGKLLQY
jgi:hypothetical protein